jgi:predicted RNase H-like nuclease (RuvC/YqgF family)
MPPPASPDLSIGQGTLFSPPRASAGQQSVPGSPSPARGPRPGSSMSDLFPDRERERDREVELMLQRRLDALIKDHALATDRADELASRLRTAERSLNERDAKLGELENQSSTDAEELKELRARVEEAKAQNEELLKQKELLQQELDRAPAKNESLLAERVELDDVKDRRIAELEAAQQAFEAQKKELMDQIDELREAGQVNNNHHKMCTFGKFAVTHISHVPYSKFPRKRSPCMKNASVPPTHTRSSSKTGYSS